MGNPTVTVTIASIISIVLMLIIFFMTYAYIYHVRSSDSLDISRFPCPYVLLGHEVNNRTSYANMIIYSSNVCLIVVVEILHLSVMR